MISSSKMKKLFATSAAATAVVCTTALAATSAFTTSDVNLRSGAGMSYSKVMVVTKGTSVSVLGESNGWTKIKVGGTVGYVGSSYVSSDFSSSSSTSTSSSTKTAYITADRLNVRSGASTSKSVIGGLDRGDKVTVVSTTGSWYKIKYGSGYGYINKSYTSSASVSGSTSSSTSSATSTKYCTASALNVRSGAGTGYSVVGTISKGQKITVKGTSGSWSKISYSGKTGYVSSKYLSSTKPSTTTGGDYTSSDTYDSDNNSSNSSIVSYAKTLLGCSYYHGGTGPSSFDCSGFTQYVYRHCGISIPRTSSSQYASAKKVSKSNMRSGDLVFFGSGSVSHVAIYIGGGQIIHAANTKSGVCISDLNTSWYINNYIGAGRY